MKRHLLRSMLLLFALIAGSGSAWADDFETVFNSGISSTPYTGENLELWNISKSGTTGYEANRGIQFQKDATGTFETNDSYDNVSEVVVAVAKSSSGTGSVKIYVNNDLKMTITSFTTTKANKTLTLSPGETGKIKVEVNATKSSIYIKSIKVTYTPVIEGTTAAPTITGNTQFFTTRTVTITNDESAEGADIYYTLNGDVPTTNETATCFKYSTPFSISENTTVKAIAKHADDDNASSVTSKIFTKEEYLTGLSGLSSSTTGTATKYYVNLTNAQVTYASGTTGYIEDATKGFYINGPSVTLNKVYNGVFALTSRLLNSNPQITIIEAVEDEGVITDGTTKAPTDIEASTLESNFSANLGRKLKISGALISTGPKVGNMNIIDLGSNSISVSKGYDLVGYPSLYNSTKRFNVVSAEQVPIDPTINVSDQSIAYNETFTVDDSQITGGDISLTSSNTSVATVSGLVITAHAEGKTTITVSTAATSDFNAGSKTFVLTVTAPTGSTTKPNAEEVISFDFSTNDDWGFPSGSQNKTVDEGSFSTNGYTIKVAGSTGEGYYYNTDGYLLMGKNGAMLTLPAFNGDVSKIIVKKGGSQASTKVEQNIYVGDVAVSSKTTGAQSDNTFLIDENYQEKGTVYVLKVISDHNTQTTGIDVYVSRDVTAPKITLPTSGFATYCCEYPLDFTTTGSNWSAWYVSNVEGTDVTFSKITGNIKGGQGFILYGTPETECQLTYADNSENMLSGNMLVGTLAPKYITETGTVIVGGEEVECTNFGLKNGKFVKAANGVIRANKAYLPIPNSLLGSDDSREFSIVFDDETTGVKTVHSSQCIVHSYYNLNGQRVQNPQKGLYIMNGKKVVVK